MIDSISLHESGLIAVVTIAIGALLLLCLYKPWVSQFGASDTRRKNRQQVERQHRIINCKDLTTGQPLPDRTEARTLPNQRLKTTFGIDNIFTTRDTEWGNKFRKLAIDTLRKAQGMHPASQSGKPDWSELVKNMKAAVQQHLQAEGNSTCINLANLVQFVTLKVSIGYLFGVPEQDLGDKEREIIFIANRINELWIQSKCGSGGQRSVPAWHEEQTIIQNLLAILPNHDPRNPRTNPMNLILPAYETMWRVVFRCLLEVGFRGNHYHKELLISYLQDPSDADKWNNEHDNRNYPQPVTAIHVVKEILRLYPPTRRIYRKYPDSESFVSADLEKMHRNGDLAGDDPQVFRPTRWLEIRRRFLNDADDGKTGARSLKDFEEELGFMPFAKVCPAGNSTTRAFGWKAIALLTGSLIQGLDRLDGEWALRASEEKDELPGHGSALSSGREDYLSLVYEKFS